MRYLGNKTKLLPSIEALLEERGLTPPGTFVDIFSGSASVARRMKRLGWRVVANDHLKCAALQARATLSLDRAPSLRGVHALPEVRAFLRSGEGKAALEAVPHPDGARGEEVEDALPSRKVIAFLNERAPSVEGLIFRQYSPGGIEDRRFFTPEVASKIDGVLATLARWRREGALLGSEEPVLLAALVDAADRCANISGTYGAFLKTWHANATKPLLLRPPLVIPGTPAPVYCEDANAVIDKIECDVLYIDPPYNHRQYAKNYHVLEVITELASVEDEAAYESEIYGRSGLRDFLDRKSAYCKGSVRGKASPCEAAFAHLVAAAKAKHIVVSYNEEGILSRDALARALGAACPGFDIETGLVEVSYKRFRSDRDGGRRTYKVLENRARDEVREWLIHAEKPRVPAASGPRTWREAPSPTRTS